MSRVSVNRHLAEALRKTLQRLDADPSIDPQDPAFIHLKCNLLQRLIHAEMGTAETESSIHIVENLPRFRLLQIFEPEADQLADGECPESASA